MKKKITTGEIILLSMTAVFLLGLFCLQSRDRQTGISVETETAVPQEQVLPERIPLDVNRATAEELEAQRKNQPDAGLISVVTPDFSPLRAARIWASVSVSTADRESSKIRT